MLGGDIDVVLIDEKPPTSTTRFATMDALLAVLPSRLPYLTYLHLGPNFTKERTILGAMFKHALCDERLFGLPTFEMHKEVKFMPRICIGKHWSHRGNDIKPDNSICPLAFFSALAIEHITGTIEEPETFKWPSTPPSPTTLTSLSITLLRECTSETSSPAAQTWTHLPITSTQIRQAAIRMIGCSVHSGLFFTALASYLPYHLSRADLNNQFRRHMSQKTTLMALKQNRRVSTLQLISATPSPSLQALRSQSYSYSDMITLDALILVMYCRERCVR